MRTPLRRVATLIIGVLGIAALAWAAVPHHNAFSLIKSRIETGHDVTLWIWSDSTGNQAAEPREWPYLLAGWLATQYPNSTVDVMPWVEDGYGERQRIAAGSGPRVTIRNFAISGAAFVTAYPLWDKAFGGPSPELLIVNMGLNLAWQEDAEATREEFDKAILRYRSDHPETPIAIIKQNPFTNRNTMDMVYQAIDKVAETYGATVVDAAGAFKALDGEDLHLPGDDTHPNQPGQFLYLRPIAAGWAGR